MTIRCAIYTRKSSEEGLDMAFNSLEAQRGAGVDYVKSQRHEGWTAIDTRYDDGGYSGGTTERPGLKKLMADIEHGRVDVVLVYKVDRLSRSLADFARLMQTFDDHKVSFVSVTQQFNTTTSMGRLTLNMLLSFAQFEREVAGERIRDKIAATKRKGVWVCGQPPIGYRLEGTGDDRGLRVVPEEAAVVREIYAGYLELGSPMALSARLRAKGCTTKRWISSKGVTHGGRLIDAAYVYKVLNNPIYLGQIAHTRTGKTELYPGLHEAIIDRQTWDLVQTKMVTVKRELLHRWPSEHLLKGKIRTFEDHAMSPSAVTRKAPSPNDKAAKPARRNIPYYISQKAMKLGYNTCPVRLVNAAAMDHLARTVLMHHLAAAHGAMLDHLEDAERDAWLRRVLTVLIVAPDIFTFKLEDAAIKECTAAVAEPHRGGNRRTSPTASATEPVPLSSCPYPFKIETQEGRTVLVVATALASLSRKPQCVLPNGDLSTPALGPTTMAAQARTIRAIGLAFSWRRELLDKGLSVERIAARANISVAHAHRLLSLTHLGPQILKAILSPATRTPTRLADALTLSKTLSWKRQDQDHPRDR